MTATYSTFQIVGRALGFTFLGFFRNIVVALPVVVLGAALGFYMSGTILEGMQGPIANEPVVLAGTMLGYVGLLTLLSVFWLMALYRAYFRMNDWAPYVPGISPPLGMSFIEPFRLLLAMILQYVVTILAGLVVMIGMGIVVGILFGVGQLSFDGESPLAALNGEGTDETFGLITGVTMGIAYLMAVIFLIWFSVRISTFLAQTARTSSIDLSAAWHSTHGSVLKLFFAFLIGGIGLSILISIVFGILGFFADGIMPAGAPNDVSTPAAMEGYIVYFAVFFVLYIQVLLSFQVGLTGAAYEAVTGDMADGDAQPPAAAAAPAEPAAAA